MFESAGCDTKAHLPSPSRTDETPDWKEDCSHTRGVQASLGPLFSDSSRVDVVLDEIGNPAQKGAQADRQKQKAGL